MFIAEKEDVSLRNKNNAKETLHVFYFSSEKFVTNMFNTMRLYRYELDNILTKMLFIIRYS